MKILNARIEWFIGYANEPQLEVLVDKIPEPSELVYEKIPFKRWFLYVAEKEGYVSFFVWSGKGNDGGYGGAEWTVKVRDGETVREELVRGPWSSRSGIINQVWKPQCMEVAITDEPDDFEKGYSFTAAALTLEKAKEAIRITGANLLKIVEKEGEIRYVPVKIYDGKHIKTVKIIR